MQRQLKIEEALTRAKTRIAYIRLRGRWLREIGFEPGTRVYVRSTEPGIIELRTYQLQPLSQITPRLTIL
jgi:hypothetical protein